MGETTRIIDVRFEKRRITFSIGRSSLPNVRTPNHMPHTPRETASRFNISAVLRTRTLLDVEYTEIDICYLHHILTLSQTNSISTTLIRFSSVGLGRFDLARSSSQTGEKEHRLLERKIVIQSKTTPSVKRASV